MGNKNSAINTKLKAKEWQWQLKMECKNLDKEIKKIHTDEEKIRKEIQAQAAQGNVSSVQMLAKSLVRSRKAVERLERTKASMHAVNLQLTTSIATMSTTASIRISADVMKKMNAIARIPEVGATIEDMRREMARCAEAEDGVEEALRMDGEEEAAAVEVQRVLDEMALEKMGPLATPVVVAPEPAAAAAVPAPKAAAAPPARQLVAVGGSAAAPAPPPKQTPEITKPAAQAAAGATPDASAAGYPGVEALDAAPASKGAPASSEDEELMRRLMCLKS